MGFSFFNAPKPRRYNYIPRFYDPDVEAWKQKKAARGIETDLSDEEKLRMRMRRSWGLNEEGESKRGYNNFRWVIIVCLVMVLVYLIFGTGVIDNIVSGLMAK